MIKFTCEFPSDQYSALAQLAERKSVPKSQILRRAVSLYFRLNEELSTTSVDGSRRRLLILNRDDTRPIPETEIWIL